MGIKYTYRQPSCHWFWGLDFFSIPEQWMTLEAPLEPNRAVSYIVLWGDFSTCQTQALTWLATLDSVLQEKSQKQECGKKVCVCFIKMWDTLAAYFPSSYPIFWSHKIILKNLVSPYLSQNSGPWTFRKQLHQHREGIVKEQNWSKS